MGWFSPIKGHYPSLGQIDKTLPVGSGSDNAGLQRGMILKVAPDTNNAEGAFVIPATIAEGDLLYIALQDYADAQAGMAGTTGFDAGVNPAAPVTPGVPTVTGLSLDMEGEYETDQYDDTIKDTDGVGTKLTVVAGKLSKLTGEGVVVAYLTSKPYGRWINNAIAKPDGETNPKMATRQGATKSVIRFRTK